MSHARASRLLRPLVTALACALPVAGVGAQTIAGRVIDRATERPVNRATVRLLAAAPADADTLRVFATTTTDSGGVFYMSAPAAGTYRLAFAVADDPLGSSDTLHLEASADIQREFRVDVPRERVYFEFQVSKPVQVRPGNAAPRYPADLRERGVTGTVLAQFIVDTTGMMRPGSFRALQASDAGFVAAVLAVVGSWRFYPAEIGGRKVAQVVQIPMSFDLAR